jgi:hypothetical protein
MRSASSGSARSFGEGRQEVRPQARPRAHVASSTESSRGTPRGPRRGRTPKRLLSVRYSLPKQGCFEANFDLPDIVVNIDLRTGKALTATDVFRPETLTSTGIATLVDRVMSRTPAKERDLAQVCFLTPPKRADFDPGGTFLTERPQPPKMSPFFTANGLTVVWSHVGSECSVFSVTLPYSESRDLLTPQITAELPR